MICSECDRLFLPSPADRVSWHCALRCLSVCYQCSVLNKLPKSKAQKILRRQADLVGSYRTRAEFYLLFDRLREQKITERIAKRRGASNVQ